jgi:hypothetical protein
MLKQSETIRIELPRPHDGQYAVEQSARRFNILCCGRRWGKDILLERRIAKRALKLRKPVAWFAPTYKMLLENWRALRHLLAPVILRASDAEHRLDLITGAPLEMWSLDNEDAGRGRKYAYIAVNEAAMVKNLANTWAMVLRPTLADFRGEADFGSTPKGLNGFFELWNAAADDKDWSRFHFRTDDNPYIPADEIMAMRLSLPERVVQQEIDAEFVEDGAYFQGVDQAAIIEQPDMPTQHKGHYVVIGADWALTEDYTVLVVGCRDCNKVVDWDRFNRIDFTYQRERLYSLAKKWHVRGVLPERNSIGAPNIELIREFVHVIPGADGGLGFNTLPTTKPPLIESLAMALSHHNFKVPKVASDELRAYQVELSTSGHPKFGAPEGIHDDWVMAIALCWHAMTSGISGYVNDPFADW